MHAHKSEPRLLCVLRSGGDYGPDDVAALRHGLNRHMPGALLQCLSDLDVPNRIPLRHDWPGWWSKMELFSPGLHGDILYLDLDSVPVGDMSMLMQTGVTTMLSDFYRPARPASGLMYLRENDRAEVWQAWIRNPEAHMSMHRVGGDQDFLGSLRIGVEAARWQELFPGWIISFKANMRPPRAQRLDAPPPGARLVCFHGMPRPKSLNDSWIVEARGGK